MLLLVGVLFAATVAAFVYVARIAARYKQSQERFFAVFDRSPIIIGLLTIPDGRLVEFNAAGVAAFGHTRDEALGRTSVELGLWADEADRARYLRALQATGHVAGFEARMRRKNGDVFTVIYSGSIIEIAGQRYSLNSLQDVSEWRRDTQRGAAFARLGRQLNTAERVEDAAAMIAGVADELFGWDSATLDLFDPVQQRCRSILNVDIVDGQRQNVPPRLVDVPLTSRMRRAIAHGADLILRTVPVVPEAGNVPFGDVTRPSASLMIVPLRDDTRVVGVLSIQSYRVNAYTKADLDTLQALADHCEGALVRIQMMAALGTSEARFRAVWDNATDGMKLCDADGRIVAVNDAYCRIMARSRAELEGRLMSSTYADDEQAFILQRFREHFAERRIPTQRDFEVTRWDGRAMVLEVDDCYIETDPERPLVLGVFRDITERRRVEAEREKMQARLFQNQKFEALGTLAGGVAHDFNNILAGMLNYAALAREDCPASATDVRDYLSEVLKGGNRAKELVRQILLLSRSESAERVPLQCAIVVREALSLLRSSIPASVEITSMLDRHAPLLSANATQIHQVVMNLGINAAHAMQPRGGRLDVSLHCRTVTADEANDIADLNPGPHLCLVVSDTGCGIEPAVIDRMFEPFFTTKKTGEGTGLGLSVVRSVVRSHGGAIAVRSTLGVGTTFELFFPVQVVEAPTEFAESLTYPRGHGERILLVDDEPMVAESMQLVIERLGYRVTACTHPADALELFADDPTQFDLVITDFQMPGMTGLELAAQLLRVRPGLDVIMATGFAGDLTEEQLRTRGLAAMVRKPFEMRGLARVLQHAFERQRGRA
ncbi:MAG: PAS domain S-box protein [Acidobacteria bacterium]|nr:PAS domain S-box protein [Acidobacteriota bacterium]